MKKFLVLYLARTSAAEMMSNSSPEEMKSGLDAWSNWAEKCGAALVDIGAPLGGAMALGTGPSAGANINGFSIIQAESLDAATDLMKDHPHLKMSDGAIELRELLIMPTM